MLTFKQSEEILRKYANEYNKSKIIELKGIEILKDSFINDKANVYIDSENKYTYYYSLQNRIDLVLERLDWDCSTFLKKEFFDANIKRCWWFNYYSRSTYYRLKKKYMNEFLGLFYA